MATVLALGTNCGFVTERPTDTPSGTSTSIVDNRLLGFRDATPAFSIHVTEIGWYSTGTSEAATYYIALYSDKAGPLPDALVVSGSGAKGTVNGWKYAAVDWTLDASTNYWIAITVQDTPTATRTLYLTVASPDLKYRNSISSPPDPFGTPDGSVAWILAVYALYEQAGTPVNVSATLSWSASISAAALTTTIVNVSATMAWTVALSADALIQADWVSASAATMKRLVVIGNNSVWYEDI